MNGIYLTYLHLFKSYINNNIIHIDLFNGIEIAHSLLQIPTNTTSSYVHGNSYYFLRFYNTIQL